jgi:CheY-like chemotaxis protein
LETAIPKGKEHILFVDDEPALIELGKKILNRMGYKVTAISDSLNAFEEYQKDPDRFDYFFALLSFFMYSLSKLYPLRNLIVFSMLQKRISVNWADIKQFFLRKI